MVDEVYVIEYAFILRRRRYATHKLTPSSTLKLLFGLFVVKVGVVAEVRMRILNLMRVQGFVENVVVATLCEAKLSVKLVLVFKTTLVELVKTFLLIGKAFKGLCFL